MCYFQVTKKLLCLLIRMLNTSYRHVLHCCVIGVTVKFLLRSPFFPIQLRVSINCRWSSLNKSLCTPVVFRHWSSADSLLLITFPCLCLTIFSLFFFLLWYGDLSLPLTFLKVMGCLRNGTKPILCCLVVNNGKELLHPANKNRSPKQIQTYLPRNIWVTAT